MRACVCVVMFTVQACRKSTGDEGRKKFALHVTLYITDTGHTKTVARGNRFF